jgi:hypothetical protein
MRRLALFVAPLALLAQNVAQAAPQRQTTEQSTIEIHGKVVFQPSQRPLGSVVVRLMLVDYSPFTMLRTGGQGTAELLAATTTNSSGLFTLRTNRQGRYEIRCQRPGKHFGSGALNVDPSKFVLIQYRADPKPFTLRPGEKPPPPAQ